MSKVITTENKIKIKRAIYKKADDFGYTSCSRSDSGSFMDELVADPDVGGILKEYLPLEKVRTYIKDGVLNAYTKEKTKKILKANLPIETIKQIYSVETALLSEGKGKDVNVSVSRAEDGRIFVISGGTVLKWETALRKALEHIARTPGLIIEGVTPSICLILAVVSKDITEGDKNHIKIALDAISIKVRFCEN
jgi:hypothetical protein